MNIDIENVSGDLHTVLLYYSSFLGPGANFPLLLKYTTLPFLLI